MTPTETRSGRAGIALALATVYLVWGSTYLAIRFAIETLPTFTMAGLRFLIAGGALYAFARATGAARPTGRDWGPAAVIGALLLLGGNGAVVWAEHRIPSGVAALLVAVEPVFIALLAPLILGGRRAGLRVLVGLLAGIAGVATLVADPLGGADATSVDWLGAAAVVAGAASWAIGSLWSVRARTVASPALGTGMQMLAGGALLTLAGGAAGEWPGIDPGAVSTRSLAAFGYLVVAGSIVAFSAYAYLLRNARPSVVATYAFVNPVVAVLLGWLFAGEPLTWRVALATALILAALALIFGERPKDEATPERADANVGVDPRSGELGAGDPEPGAPRLTSLDPAGQAPAGAVARRCA